MRRTLAALLVAGCVETGIEPTPPTIPPPPPPVTPPPSWGAPISGGNLAVHPDGRQVAIADPDRDKVMLVDLTARQVTAVFPLELGDEPGRLAWDGAGRLHVALRRGGQVVSIDGSTLGRRPVCPEPRGLAWDPTGDVLHVACVGGELVTLPAAGGEPARVLRLDRDLRDVIVVGDGLVVTRFRSAEMLRLDGQGQVLERTRPPTLTRHSFDLEGAGAELLDDAVAAVAWRAIALPDGGVLLAHQRQIQRTLAIRPGGYGNDCGGAVESTSTIYRPGVGSTAGRSFFFEALPVDVAVNADGSRYAFALAGNYNVRVVNPAWVAATTGGPCDPPPPEPPPGESPPEIVEFVVGGESRPTSVAFSGAGELLVFYPEEPALDIVVPQLDRFGNTDTIHVPLGGRSREDLGRELFHQMTFAGLACASCHPEGREDGQVWEFELIGARRTQSIAGGILSRAPYHWDGDMDDLPTLLEEVFVGRMGGNVTDSIQAAAIGPWLDRIPAPAPSAPLDAEAAARGRVLFESDEAGCRACHTGPQLTNNLIYAVGTGDKFKVPSLRGVAARAPFLHDGCAATLEDRFGPCGGGALHGDTSFMSEGDLRDLVAYLETL